MVSRLALYLHKISCVFWQFLFILLPLCIFISSSNAFMRKFSDIGSNAFLELQWYLFSAVFLLAAGRVLKNDGHIRIDIFYAKMTKRQKSYINLITHSILTLPSLGFLIYLTMPFFLGSIMPTDQDFSLWHIGTYIFDAQSHEISPNAGGLATWYAKILLPLGFILLFCAVLSEILNHLDSLYLNPPLSGEDHD